MTDTLDKQKTVGQLFTETLEATKADKDKMFRLLSAALEKTRANPSNKISDNDTLVEFKARLARYNAKMGCELNPEDYVYMTAKKYKDAGYGNIVDFKKDFKTFSEKGILQQTPNHQMPQSMQAERAYTY